LALFVLAFSGMLRFVESSLTLPFHALLRTPHSLSVYDRNSLLSRCHLPLDIPLDWCQ
jgi:hypothetical protein